MGGWVGGWVGYLVRLLLAGKGLEFGAALLGLGGDALLEAVVFFQLEEEGGWVGGWVRLGRGKKEKFVGGWVGGWVGSSYLSSVESHALLAQLFQGLVSLGLDLLLGGFKLGDVL